MKHESGHHTHEAPRHQSSVRRGLLSLRARMAFSFGVLFAVILILVSLIRTFGLPLTSDQGSFGDARDLLLRQLNLLADLNKERLLLWLEEHTVHVTVLSENGAATSSIRKLLDVIHRHANSGRPSSELHADLLAENRGQTLTEALHAFIRSHKVYRRIQVADVVDGFVIASTDERDLGIRLPDRLLPSVGGAGGRASVILDKSPDTGEPYVLICRTITDKSAARDGGTPEVLGLLIMYIDEERFVEALLQTGGIGQTEEVVLVDQDLRTILPLKYPVLGGALAGPLEYRVIAEPAILAAQGKEGVAATRDYREVPVFAAYRHIKVGPDSGWGLVVKVDQDELLGTTRQRLLHGAVVSLLGVAAALVMAAVIAGRIARPLRELSRAATQVEAGNLNARAAVVSSDEVGNLAAIFNSMIERVRNWHEDLEEQVRNRTLRLTELNEELTREVAERKRGEERIREQTDFLETVLESLAHPFYVVDAGDYTILMANSAAALGKMQDRSTCYRLTHGRTKPCSGEDHLCPLEDVRQTKQPVVAEHVHYDRDGNARHVEVHAHPIFDVNGRVVQVIEYSLDITDRKRSENEQVRLITELEAKNAELERFTYTVSHDLKSPLITIKGFLGYLEQDLLAGNVERLRADSARIHGAVDKMGRLLDELLELSRIGRIVNPPQEIALDKLVREVLETLAGRIAEREVRLDIAQDLPVLYGDAVRLREVVENLVDNAVKFMGDQPHPRVEIGVRRDGESDVIFVKDNGIGIDSGYHAKIFGLFERLGHHGEGTGIGLTIVKRIIEVHGGRIWVESEGVGHGSVFCFALPGRNEGNTVRR